MVEGAGFRWQWEELGAESGFFSQTCNEQFQAVDVQFLLCGIS